MKNKKSLMCISAIMIYIFHLWIPILTNNHIEIFLRYICYIGVDIFFFLSAYSLASKEIKYKDFLKNRFINIYLKFLIFLIIATIYKGYDLQKSISIITGYEFINKGGGSFLWFIPAIMLLYIIIPLYKKVDNKQKILTPIFLTFIWLFLSIIVSLNTNYNAIFIFTNRIPIFMIGYYISKYQLLNKMSNKKTLYLTITIILLILGSFLSYTSYLNHLKNFIIYDIFYLTNIPLILGIIMLINILPSNKLIDSIGSVSLELYAFQMIFGFLIINKLYLWINNALLTNILGLLLLLILSYIFNFIFNKIITLVKEHAYGNSNKTPRYL